MGKILVVGSSNTDLIVKVESFPAAGETIEGVSFLQSMGGKGANQALAAHKLGGDVTFITSLGNDANGKNALKYYEQEGLDVGLSLIVDNVPSGTAMIWVDQKGENCIVIIQGANKMLTSEYIYKIEEVLADSDMIVLQMEIPYETVKTVCELAHRYQKTVMLNVAPAHKLDDDLIKNIDILVVNEPEAEVISGLKIADAGEEAVIDAITEMGIKTVVMTLGKKGCLLKDSQGIRHFPAFTVKTIDSTAAGDTFCGALAAGLSRGIDWESVLRFASAASAICVTRMGAQPSIPSEEEVKEFLSGDYMSAT